MFWRLAAAFWCCILTAQTSPKEQFEQAAAALQQGDLTKAEALFSAFLRSEPRHVGGLGNLGVVYSRQGLPAKAAAVWERALALAPQDPAIRTNLGLAYLRLEQYDKARAVLQPVMTAQGRELYASALLYSGAFAEAAGILAGLPPTAGVLYLRALAELKQGHRAEAAVVFDKLVSTALNSDQAAYLKGKAMYETGAFEEALASFAEVKRPVPGFDLELGKVYVSLRDAAKAEVHLRAAVKEAPLDSEANYFLGALLVQEKRAAEAFPFLEAARRVRPDFWGSHFYLGRALIESGKFAEAAKSLEHARMLRPSEPLIDFHLSKALASLGKIAESKAALERFRNARASRQEASREALVLK